MSKTNKKISFSIFLTAAVGFILFSSIIDVTAQRKNAPRISIIDIEAKSATFLQKRLTHEIETLNARRQKISERATLPEYVKTPFLSLFDARILKVEQFKKELETLISLEEIKLFHQKIKNSRQEFRSERQAIFSQYFSAKGFGIIDELKKKGSLLQKKAKELKQRGVDTGSIEKRIKDGNSLIGKAEMLLRGEEPMAANNKKTTLAALFSRAPKDKGETQPAVKFKETSGVLQASTDALEGALVMIDSEIAAQTEALSVVPLSEPFPESSCSPQKAASYAAKISAKATELGIALSGSNFLGCDQRNPKNGQKQDELPISLANYDGVIFFGSGGNLNTSNVIMLPTVPEKFMTFATINGGNAKIELTFQSNPERGLYAFNHGLYLEAIGGNANVTAIDAPPGTKYGYRRSGGNAIVLINGQLFKGNGTKEEKGEIPPLPSPPKPTVDIKANDSDEPITISYGTSATITWSSVNADSCAVSPTNWSGVSGSQSTGILTASQIYSLSCTGQGGSAQDSVTINLSSAYKFGDYRESITVDGRSRTYLLHIPTGFSIAKQYPLVAALHGGEGNGEKFAGQTKFREKADAEEFIAVFPDGIDNGWADGRGTSEADMQGVNDVKFIRELVSRLQSKLPIDSKKIYATGVSNGGMMSYRLGCDAADLFAAIAPDIANLPEPMKDRCNPANPIPIVAINGLADPLVPYGGGECCGKAGSIFGGQGGRVLSTVDTFKIFAQENGCATTYAAETLPVIVRDGTSVEKRTYNNCPAGNEVISYVVAGMGHVWPPNPAQAFLVSGPSSKNINATDVFWEFFEGHTKK